MLISNEYLEQQRQLHENPRYGVMSAVYAPLITQLAQQLEIKEMLDYGCGKGLLGDLIRPGHPIEAYRYDPCVEQFSARPSPAELVVCIDVLEHIEPEFLDNVLEDLRQLTKRMIFLTVATEPAMKTLPDGRNAHLIQQPIPWWLERLKQYFDLRNYKEDVQGFWAVMLPKAEAAEA